MRGLEVRLRAGAERAEVLRFTRTLNEVVASLREIDRAYHTRRSEATWVVADTGRDQGDFVIKVELRAPGRNRDIHDMMVPAQALVEGVELLAQVPEVPRYYLPQTVRRLATIGQPGHGVRRVELATYNGRRGRPVPVSDEVLAHAATAVRAARRSLGSVVGTLEALRAGRGARRATKVTIFEPRTRRAVSGRVANHLVDQLPDAWGHRVALGGLLVRNERGQVVDMEVDRLERLPETPTRPSTTELLGIAPDWIDGMDVDEYVASVRGA